jgi:azurin
MARFLRMMFVCHLLSFRMFMRLIRRTYNRFIWLLFDNKGDCEIIHIAYLETGSLDKGVLMNLKVRSWLSVVALASALALTACGSGGGGTGGTGDGGGANLNVSTAGEALQFAPAALNATAGQAVKVTFKNGSAAQKHNWVLVNGGDDVAAKVDEAGAGAGEAAGYIPTDPAIIGKTKLVNGSETDTASFTAPAAGTYTFLCTFPGHYVAGMKGTLTVK